jgi:hypothetical protein
MPSRFSHRIRQFWNALPFTRWPVAAENLRLLLTPSLIDLFRRMQPFEQAHSYRVLERLQAYGETNPHLLAAALLHDAGKVLHPLSIPDRVAAVLGAAILPRQARRWGKEPMDRLHRPFVVAAQHPAWGAELAEKAGASPITVDLIRRHHEIPSAGDLLLLALRSADEE